MMTVTADKHWEFGASHAPAVPFCEQEVTGSTPVGSTR